ncbi:MULTISPECIES: hypothetical protein [Cryobacterium]|uniref:Uncharacterized protein n=1 Tax=Cryobacterium breve TaxID=1259258 RepID=A0ABY2JAM4_9MICO|nr:MULTISPECIES: hypothetical protein [Cryobacterium]TFC94512.1 hypothetical protein E3T20_08430 [Cryobacterium sp. TmT3-12]TFD01988.1 hypothetical protein E3O65_00350 [Cryobacterium breve]
MKNQSRIRGMMGAVATCALSASLLVTGGGAAFADEASVNILEALGSASPSTLEDVAGVVTSDSGQLAIDAQLSSALISVPVDPAAGIVAQSPHSDTSFTIGLPFAGEASSAKVEAEGIVSYDNLNGSTTVPVVKADGTIQINTVIENADAPTRYDYPLSLPGGGTIVDDGAGGFIVSDATQVIAAIAAPWAKDADGVEVATRYELTGTTLTQVVEHRAAGVAYPVVADPKVSTLWWGIAIKLTHAETVAMANNFTPAYISAAFCGFIPVPLGNVACGVAVGIRLWTWEKPIKDAASQAGRCAQLNAPYVGGVVAWNVTNERC